MGFINQLFYTTEKSIARHPFLVFFFCLSLSLVCSLGFMKLRLITEAQQLWVAATSRGNVEQTYFNEQFGFFFRINQMILRCRDAKDIDIDVFQPPYLEMIYLVQSRMEDYVFELDNQTFNLTQFCYKPITGKGCMTTSPMEYWLMNLTDMWSDVNIKETAQCVRARYPDHNTCFDRIGVPVMKNVIFGDSNAANDSGSCVPPQTLSHALIVTYLLNNNPFTNGASMQWEKAAFEAIAYDFNDFFLSNKLNNPQESDSDLTRALRNLYKRFPTLPSMKVDYMSERSIPDDLSKQNGQNIGVVIISYSLMFIYVSISLGYFPNKIHTRFLVGLSGIVIVLLSMLDAIGLVSYFDVGTSMISSEVVPFLILAIGVDNMFIIVRAEKSVDPSITEIDERLAKALSIVGPSILTAAVCEFLAFMVGTLTEVPALQSFCLTAAVAVIIDFIFQITAFVAIISLDNNRIKNHRADIIPCLIVKNPVEPSEDKVNIFFKKYYTPIVLSKITQIIAFTITATLLVFSGFAMTGIEMGITPQASVTTDSAIFNYFGAQGKYVDAGPPAYLVFRDVNYTDPTNSDTIFKIIDALSALNKSIIKPITTWIKPFKMFLTESGGWSTVCGTQGINSLSFNEQMKRFVQVPIESPCCLQYGICGEQFVKDIAFDENSEITSTRFRFAHTPLRVQADYIRDMEESRYVTDQFIGNLTMNENAKKKYEGKTLDESRPAFIYSLFYVYMEQYYFIRGVLIQNILLALAVVIFASHLITNLRASMFVGLCVLLTSFEVIGVCYMLDLIIPGFKIEFNAVFVVNVVMCCGLAVEFCVHLVLAFLRAKGTKKERVTFALNNMGSSILIGIGSTKFIGVLVLAFAPSTIFRLYYFRMYFSIIILGLINGVMTLPIILSYIGPPHDPRVTSEEEKGEMGEGLVKYESAEESKNPNE